MKDRTEYFSEYRKENRERIRIYKSVWRNKNRKKIRAYDTVYRTKNKTEEVDSSITHKSKIKIKK